MGLREPHRGAGAEGGRACVPARHEAVRNYLLVTRPTGRSRSPTARCACWCCCTSTRSAIRPVELAFLFLFYEFFGVVTNLLGGWLGRGSGCAHLFSGLGLQVGALRCCSCSRRALTVPWPYVMAAQALSGIAKDLTKMSAKSAIKVLVPEAEFVALQVGGGAHRLEERAQGRGLLPGRAAAGCWASASPCWAMAGALAARSWWAACSASRPSMGKAKGEGEVHRPSCPRRRSINVLSAARFFLFGARDIWFVVGVPVFLSVHLGWGFTEVGASWPSGSSATAPFSPQRPRVIRRFTRTAARPRGGAQVLAFLLAGVHGGMSRSASSAARHPPPGAGRWGSACSAWSSRSTRRCTRT
jgi:hypothetical protein